MTGRGQRLLEKLLQKPLQRMVREALAVREDENSLLVGARSLDEGTRDRYPFDRAQILEDCLDAWRLNPLARRIVELTSQYVVGGGLVVRCGHAPTQAFINTFWQAPLNRMDVRLVEMCDELTRTGNLFLLLSTDQVGMSYLRVVPASQINTIDAAENDIEQPLRFICKPEGIGEVRVFQAYRSGMDGPDQDGRFPAVMLHYAVNKPAGAQWGEPDLAPMLRWLARYAAWLEARVRLNRFPNAFLYVVKALFNSEAARHKRQLELAANPPSPGSILVTDESEDWSVISPRLEALDASTDGLAVKKMIAAGAGVPLHFLAEPESATRTTAEASGGPTFRRFEQRQHFFRWLVKDLLGVVLARRAMLDGSVDPGAGLAVYGQDISARDNRELAEAGSKVGEVCGRLYELGLMDKEELLRIVYRFLGERREGGMG